MPSVSLSSVLNQPVPSAPPAPVPARPSLLSVLGIGGPAPASAPVPGPVPSAPSALVNRPVVLTESGAAHVRAAMKAEGHDPDGTWVRLGVKGGGCSGLGYSLDFSRKVDPTDLVFDSQGIKIVVDRKSMIYLGGTRVDWVNGLKGHGWRFENPNEKRGCSCGQSFTV